MEASQATLVRQGALALQADYRRAQEIQVLKSFFDTSALVKVYLYETGSERTMHLLDSAKQVGISSLCLVEVIAVLCRCERERRITRSEYLTAKSNVVVGITDMDCVQVTPEVVDRAIRVLELIPLRAADALHVASAIEWGAQVFISADRKQLEAARRAGLACKAV